MLIQPYCQLKMSITNCLQLILLTMLMLMEILITKATISCLIHPSGDVQSKSLFLSLMNVSAYKQKIIFKVREFKASII